MLTCAICDDDGIVVETVEAMVTQILRENGCAGTIHTYTDPAMLLSDVLDGLSLDLVILDIEMPGYSGIEVADAIKKRFTDCIVIFLTSHLQYAVESYELQIFRYTPKRELETKLPRYIRDALTLLTLQNGCVYHIIKNESVERLPYRQILYLRKDGKYAVICCVDGREIRVRKPLNEVFAELDGQEFLMIDRGCIVNIALIDRISDREAVCKNGQRLPISRTKYQETKSRIVQYWGVKL